MWHNIAADKHLDDWDNLRLVVDDMFPLGARILVEVRSDKVAEVWAFLELELVCKAGLQVVWGPSFYQIVLGGVAVRFDVRFEKKKSALVLRSAFFFLL